MDCKFWIWVSFLSITVHATSRRYFINGTLSPTGYITDGEGAYKRDTLSEWLIEAPHGESITLNFSVLVTECSFDYIFIYDGRSQEGENTDLLATVSGSSTPSSFHAKSGSMLVVFFTDQNSNRLGFNATYRVSPCPNDCNQHLSSKHECVKDETSGSYHCECGSGYYEGDDCSIPTCIEGCGYHAFRGDCVKTKALSSALANREIVRYGCVCESSFFGESCILETDKKRNYHTWTRLFSNKRAGPTPATGAAAVVVKKEQDVLMYIFGGFDLTSVISKFLVYDVFRSSWRDEIPNSDQVPSARAFHTMTLIENSKLVVIGGVLKFHYSDQSERMAHSVWVYDTAAKVWTEYNSSPSVPAIADHTATLVDHEIFVIGGRLANDSFNHLIYVLDTQSMTWTVQNPRGHSSLFLRRVGHSTVYDRTRRALVIFGGYVPSKPNFSIKTNDMFAYSPSENYLSKWETVERDPGAKPDNLAQHTAVVMGNYMVVFGGSMSEEMTSAEDTCVMNQTFLFHLDCHMWIDNDKVLIGSGGEVQDELVSLAEKLSLTVDGLSMALHAPPPRKGHVAVLLDDNLMAIYGGYDGTVRSDIYVYKAAPTLFDRNEETHCREASIDETLCHRDPKCRYCPGYVGTNNRCVSPQQLEERPCESDVTQGMCPGVCASMTDCKSCLLFGDTLCGWCSATQTCQNLTDANCPALAEGMSGLVRIKDSCKRDSPSGFLKSTYFQPDNPEFPDYVSFGVNPDLHIFFDLEKEARYDVSMQSAKSHSPIIIELSGRLFNANQKRPKPSYQILIENANVTLTLNVPVESTHFRPAVDALNQPLPIDFMINRSKCANDFRSGGCRMQLYISQKIVNRQGEGQMTIFWDGESDEAGDMKPMSVAHLLPHYNDPAGCDGYRSCITCTGKGVGQCGWDPITDTCVFKWADTKLEVLNEALTLYPHQCSVCIHYIECETCNSHPGCIWARTSTTVQCLRKPPQNVLDEDSKLPSKQQKYKSSGCLPPCHQRKTCQQCFLLDSENERKSECSWCASLNKCLPFYMYLPAYSYGVCKSYSEKNTPEKCAECSQFQKCSKCLSRPGCGFCESNGQCVEGGFDGPTDPESSCFPPGRDYPLSGHLTYSLASLTSRSPSLVNSFHFTKCPKTDECVDPNLCPLQIQGSKCVNTEDSYRCECPSGHKVSNDANGKAICQKTCEKSCGQNGICEQNDVTQEFECICDKGYYGEQCQYDCNCNKRSHCKQKGQCLKCDEGYQGHDCGSCQDGWYEYMGECRRCKCNGNGDPRKGFCDKENGRCFCVNNTDGDHCDRCKESAGYYSKPGNNNVCYKMCTGWAIMSGIDGISYIGSEQGDGAKNPERVVCIWQISTNDDVSPKSPAISGGSKITFEITALNVECNEQYVYVYENTPSFLTGEGATSESSMNSDNHQRDKILGAFCGNDSPRHKRVVEAESTITVVFKANVTQGNQYFNAKISVHEKPCMGNWIPRGEDSCECPMNMTGWNCDQIACPNNCSAHLNQGNCVEDERSFCNCSHGFSGDDCSAKITRHYKAQWSNLLKGTFAREAKYGRLGHTMVADGSKKFLYIIGGRNFNANPVDMLKYSIDENKLSTVRSDFLIIPYRGYYHSSAITDSDTVYVFGGLGQMNHKCSRTFWHFIPDAKTQNEKIQMPTVAKDDYPAYSEPGHTWIPTAAQHTMNYVKLKKNRWNNGTVEVLIIIGGYSPEHGFNNYTLQYNIETKAWSSVYTVGTKPIGIFGHSTVYYENWSTFYVYGGYVYTKNSVSLSKELYAMKYEQDGRPAKWSVVYPKGDLRPPSAIAFHQSVIIGEYMVVIGGRTKAVEFSNEVRIYLITCNAWVKEGESFAADKVFNGTHMDPVIGHSAVAIGNDIYIYGGFNGVTLQSMHKLSMPYDICNLLNGAERTECERIPGCSFCPAHEKRAECGFQDSCCFNASNKASDGDGFCKSHPGEWAQSRASSKCYMPPAVFSPFPFWPSTMRAECSKHETCEQCLSEYEPYYMKTNEKSTCMWLSDQERCEQAGAHETSSFMSDFGSLRLDQCRGTNEQVQCHQSDCQKCHDVNDCQWSVNYKAESNTAKVTFSSDGVFEWGCFPGFLHRFSQIPKEDTCPAPCHSFENCSSCLNSGGADGGWKQCYWAQELGICISPTFAAMQCAAGECGRVVTHSAEGCPKVCEDQTQCATCAQMTHCGWCSLQSGAEHLGLGACWEGGLNGPRQQRCTSDSVISHLLSRPKTEQTLETYILFSLRGHSWSHSSCPQEDECTNNHHNCDSKTQNCVDLNEGFKCECKQDFSYNEKTGECEPQCDPPCSQFGWCAEPNSCKCHLGYKGATCDDSCPCYGHSECSNDDYKPCKQCQHNTVGANCDSCLSKYYGNATSPTATACSKCSELCNHKSEYCIDSAVYEKKFKHLTTDEEKLMAFDEYVEHGPKNRSQIVCVMCQNHTSGDFCEKCEDGYYKDSDSGECVPCQCNGHADRNYCDPETGLDCECKGHTKSPYSCEETTLSSDMAKTCASQRQCSVCSKPGEYIGDPKDGRHCYRLMETFTNTFYIDPENKMYYNIDMSSPEAVEQMGLHPGQASFFYVQPTIKTGVYTHRVVLEILHGSVDLYVTDDYRMVRMDQTNASQAKIDLYDINGKLIPPRPKVVNVTDKSLIENRHGSTISSSDIVKNAVRSKRSLPFGTPGSTKSGQVSTSSNGNTSVIDYGSLKVRSVPPPRRESVVVLNALFTPDRNAMYVPLRNRKTVLIATNITGRFEVIIPNNDYYKKLSRRRENYYFVIHNSNEVDANEENGLKQTSTGIIYQVRKQVKMSMLMVTLFAILGAVAVFAFVLAFYLLYAYTVREPLEPQDNTQNSTSSGGATVQVSLYFTSQLDSLPDKKSEVKSGSRGSHRKSAPQLGMGRQKYLQKVLALQPFKNNKEGPMTVLFETPAVSDAGKEFFFGTAIISLKNSKEQPDIVAGNPPTHNASQSSINFYNRSLSAREYSGSTNWFSTLQTHSPTRFGGGGMPGEYSRGASVSTSDSFYNTPAPNFSSLSRGRAPYHPMGYGVMMPLSGSMASPPHDSSMNTLSRNSLQRVPRSQTFFQQRTAMPGAASPNVTGATQLNLTSATSLI